MNFFSGIGSREITQEEIYKIEEICKYLNEFDFTCLSGNADGSDITFQKNSNKYIAMLPWKDFNFNSFIPKWYHIVESDDLDAINSVMRFHPAANRLSQGAFKLMARNFRQVVNSNCDIGHVNFVIYCASEFNGNVMGGTAQAVRIAKSLNIPVFNIRKNSIDNAIKFINNNL